MDSLSVIIVASSTLMFNRFILLLIVVYSGIDGRTLSLACPLVQYLRFVCKAGGNILWHIQVKEEKYLDNEMVHQPCLYSSVLILYPSCQ